MSSAVDEELYRRAAALLEPGDIELHGAVVHTALEPDEESRLHQTTLDVGDAIAAAVGAGDTYVYSGNDDEEFGLNQHQGLTLDGDEFVWECQQLLRDAQYDVVFYWEAAGVHGDVCDAARDVDGVTAVVPVTEEGAVEA